jgi:hypothetical protein
MKTKEIEAQLNALHTRTIALERGASKTATGFGPGTFVHDLAAHLEDMEHQAHLLGQICGKLREDVQPLMVKGLGNG